jgi:hypothetical protein
MGRGGPPPGGARGWGAGGGGGGGGWWCEGVCRPSTSVCRPSQYSESGVYVCACGPVCRFGSTNFEPKLAAGAWTTARKGCNPTH